MRRLRRTWSIRARTALTFALAAMALATGVVVFSNVMSLAGVGAGLDTTAIRGASQAETFVTASPVPIGERSAANDAPPSTTVAVVRLVAVQQWQWSAIGIAGAGLVAGGVGWLVSRRMLRPIDRITATANRITASNLHERIALEGPDDELRRLSGTVDDLLDRLQTAFESQRRFVAQASHELRTPLAVQRAAMQIGLHDGAGADDVRVVREELLAQNRRTEHLVESLLVLAEADRGLAGVGTSIDLVAIADEVVAGAAGSAHEAGVTITHEGRAAPPGRPTITGEPMLVRQLLVNLVGNAVEYNEAGGFVRVTTRGDGLVVENSGPVVPDEVAPLLVEPFRRCSEVASGGRHSGLGLSIVASIVHAHGWRLVVTARREGGLRIDVSSV
ncbi:MULTISPECIES: ATP-binding protein [unclassified Curtobacterium]|uniref:sensor histidine kinase n=1 Tax=unclassified Curtobacterium TaxID=257496 RepID=UPI0010477B9A|nr:MULTISPECIES: ATP-binding protein [unclassified Curtobacterium]TCL79289.1 signal transduction histidine kinase [Curtobacterium sp. PhB128]TCL97239.1 signal transduction histidine kinase [Curtobacterium sp. PhB138]